VADIHEGLFLNVCANKAAVSDLYKNPESQKARPKSDLYMRDLRGTTPNSRPLIERPGFITKDLRQLAHPESATLVGAAYKKTIVTPEKLKDVCAVMCWPRQL
jgi:hypothetical protein